MKSILISIKPKWVAKILNGEKTIEIRKTMPKCDLPIDVYIYCTKEETLVKNGTIYFVNNLYKKEKNVNRSGKVVAKFTLNKVEEIETCERHSAELIDQSCLSADEFYDYLMKGKNFLGRVLGCAIHIDNLEIFDEPKKLREFRKVGKPCKYQGRDTYCDYCSHCDCIGDELTKAPQSYMFIEVD